MYLCNNPLLSFVSLSLSPTLPLSLPHSSLPLSLSLSLQCLMELGECGCVIQVNQALTAEVQINVLCVPYSSGSVFVSPCSTSVYRNTTDLYVVVCGITPARIHIFQLHYYI